MGVKKKKNNKEEIDVERIMKKNFHDLESVGKKILQSKGILDSGLYEPESNEVESGQFLLDKQLGEAVREIQDCIFKRKLRKFETQVLLLKLCDIYDLKVGLFNYDKEKITMQQLQEGMSQWE
jgi:hypothetical protein|tara:strand:+ start:3416 stop:3784 length:369 start_codon:yes stop_codon:yes gene_type:complete